MTGTIFTIGHSTRLFDEFLDVLKVFLIEMIADVRTIHKSRHNPQFNMDSLRAELEINGIGYIHIPGLGGLRHTTAGSINTGWTNPSFRGYADYMQTLDFKNSLEELINLAREKVTAIMCAEAVPWRCHRSLIGDALLIQGFKVEDIMNNRIRKPHKLTRWAKVDEGTIIYPRDIMRGDRHS
jgi:uncharacterized protein (DUF488 family)